MTLWDKSINAFAPVGLVAAYVEGHAMHELASSIASDKSYDTVLSGTDRFFKTRVTMHSAASATITTCDDASKFELVNRETGIVDPNFSNPPDQQYMFYTFQMIQQHGHWAISDASGVTLPDPRAIPCQPLRTPLCAMQSLVSLLAKVLPAFAERGERAAYSKSQGAKCGESGQELLEGVHMASDHISDLARYLGGDGFGGRHQAHSL